MKTLHIINGDGAGDSLSASGLSGDVLVCHDLLYEGIRSPGWPDDTTLNDRAAFLEEITAGGVGFQSALKMIRDHYRRLSAAPGYGRIVLWFDACLCDQVMLAHILVCLDSLDCHSGELVCIASYPGIERFDGLGQLQPLQLKSLFSARQKLTSAQFIFAERVDRAFATQDMSMLAALATEVDVPLPYIPAAAARWLLEQPDPKTGLGRLEFLALEAVRHGLSSPLEIFTDVAAADTPPQYWGDTTLWRKINSLAERLPPLVRIEGPTDRLPLWADPSEVKKYTIHLTC